MRRSREAARARRARAAGAADARGRTLAGARDATSPRSGCTCAISTRSRPDMRLFPDFDDNLRQAFRRETELFVESVLREDRSVLDLLNANYTFVNERLAKHYGIPHVYGSRFRRVTLDRRQLARRTASPGQHPDGHVVRDPDVAGPARQMDARQPSWRAAAASAARRAGAEGQHRGRQPVGAEAAGRASEQPDLRRVPQPDGSGRACRSRSSTPSAAGGLPKTGRRSTPPEGCPTAAGSPTSTGSKRRCCAGRSCSSARFAEKLLTYALGRGVEYYDAPAIRAIVRDARPQNYRMSSIILGIVNSKPFQMRTSR